MLVAAFAYAKQLIGSCSCKWKIYFAELLYKEYYNIMGIYIYYVLHVYF